MTAQRLSDAEMCPWSGEMPPTWGTARLKRLVDLVNEKTSGTGRGYVGLENIEPWTGRLVEATEAAPGEGLASLFAGGDVLFGKLRPYLAKAHLATRPGRCTSELLVLRPRSLVAEYLRYVLLADPFISLVDSSTFGAKMPRADWEFVGRVVVPHPPPQVQRAIADFLDRKTAAIDAMTAKLEQFAAVLDEERLALITQAVTKGLHPNAAMQDSGVEWLGAIPVNWQVSRSKRLFQQRKQRAHVEDEQLTASQSYGVIPQREYTARTGQRVTQLTTNFDLRKRVERDDFVISMRSFQGGLERAWASGGIRSSYVVLKPSNAVDVGYFTYLFKCSAYISALQATALFIRDGQDLTFENFVLVDLPLPPREEQQCIAAFLDATVSRMNELRERAEGLVDMLREYRQALVTAAVTGQLDVNREAA